MKIIFLILSSVGIINLVSLFSISDQGEPDEVAKMIREANTIHNNDYEKSKKLFEEAYGLANSNPQSTLEKSNLAELKYSLATLDLNEYKNYERADSLLSSAALLYSDIKNWKGVSLCYNELAVINYQKGNIKEAYTLIEKALFYALKINDHEHKAVIYFQYAFMLQKEGKFQRALIYAFNSLTHAEKTGDSYCLSLAYYELARLKTNLHSYKDALEYIKKADQHSSNAKTTLPQRVAILTLYGDILVELGYLNESREIMEQALHFAIQSNQPCATSWAYEGLGKTFIRMQNWTEAKEYFNRTIQLAHEGFQLPFHQITLSKAYALMGDTGKALQLVKKFDHDHPQLSPTIENIDFYKDISFVYQKAGKSEKALKYYKYWHEISDSLRGTDNKLLMAEMERKYEVEKRDAEISRHELHLVRSYNRQLWLGGLLVLVSLGGGTSFFLYRGKVLRENQALQIEMKENQLRQTLAAQENERKKLARELHDGIGQSLAALKMQMQMGSAHPDPKAIQGLDNLCREIRFLSHQMMPLVLQENGIQEAVEWLVNQSFANSEIEVSLVSNGFESRFDPSLEIHLYRITQELISNIFKHSQATQVSVQLLQKKEKILLFIEDNGKGYDIKKPTGDGIGIANITSRVESIGGNLKIESEEGKGTFVRIIIPLTDENRMIA